MLRSVFIHRENGTLGNGAQAAPVQGEGLPDQRVKGRERGGKVTTVDNIKTTHITDRKARNGFHWAATICSALTQPTVIQPVRILAGLLMTVFLSEYYTETAELTQRSLNTFYDEIYSMCTLVCLHSLPRKPLFRASPACLTTSPTR